MSELPELKPRKRTERPNRYLSPIQLIAVLNTTQLAFFDALVLRVKIISNGFLLKNPIKGFLRCEAISS